MILIGENRDTSAILEHHRTLGRFYLAIGTSGNQYKNGPMVGILMAELIEACEKGHDHDADPVRVTCPITGNVLNAGFYSRNRAIDEDSSFSVLG